jgi:hypothetical protein
MAATRSQSRQRLLSPTDLSINAAAINAEVISTTFELEGIETLDIFVDYTYAAGTAVTVELDTNPLSEIQDSTPTWFKTQSVAISTGTGTLSDFLFSKTVSAANQTFDCSFVGINALRGRIRIVATGSPTTSDVATVYAISKQK